MNDGNEPFELPMVDSEEEWGRAPDPQPILELVRDAFFNRGKADANVVRKFRLFVCACCRSIWRHMPPEGRAVVDRGEELILTGTPDGGADRVVRAAERAAGGRPADPAGVTHQSALLASLGAAPTVSGSSHTVDAAHADALQVIGRVVNAELGRDTRGVRVRDRTKREQKVRRELAALARDIFGNPFRTIRVARRRWVTAEVRELAQTILAAGTFDRLPELGDLLASEGCDELELLAHCRAAGPHARGCWAVDLLLGFSFDGRPVVRSAGKQRARNSTPPPALEPGAVWVDLGWTYGVVFMYDEAHRTALEESAMGELGPDIWHSRELSALQRKGFVYAFSFDAEEREAPFVGQVLVGSLQPSGVTTGSAKEPQRGRLLAPTGRLRLAGCTALRMGPERPEKPDVEVRVPSGTYDVGFYTRSADQVPLLVLTPTN